MNIKVVLLTVLLFQLLYLSVKVKNDKHIKHIKHYIPAFIISVITAWSIYKTFTLSGFEGINSAIFSAVGLFVSFVFTKHPPFLKAKI
ncbi:hypothetical protein [Halobacillus kuroshimensis]|uniref:hypothetical protein n=1 Tax=Halobacillus kuroshimensis TaxID=302481 RepID=UPI000419F181|nr:hypothetical protein [Halobacillus kuroshimensis]